MITEFGNIQFGILGFILFAGYSPCFAGRAQGSELAGFVDRRVMTVLLELVNKESNVAVLRFTSGFPLDEVGKKSGQPFSAMRIGPDLKPYLHVEGTFNLVRNLAGDPPKLGQVKESFPFNESLMLRPEWDERFRRIKPVFSQHSFDPENDNSVLILAVWGKKPASVLDATFFGPLEKNDPDYLTAMADLLSKHPYSQLTKEHAEKLLESGNPWLAYLALARLEALKRLTVNQYARSIKAMPVANTRAATSDFLAWESRNHKEKEATEEIVALFGKLAPEKERTFLYALNQEFHLNPRLIERYVILPDLQNAAKAYRAKILNDLARREVVHQLDRLIELHVKN